MTEHLTSWPPPDGLHPGAYLLRRFLEPLGISPAAFARGTGMSRSRVSELLHGKRTITANTAARIGAFLGMEPAFWMSLQARYDLAATGDVTGQVTPADTRGFLVGPSGARRFERTKTPRPTSARVPADLMARLRQKAAATPRSPSSEPYAIEYPNGSRAVVSRANSSPRRHRVPEKNRQ